MGNKIITSKMLASGELRHYGVKGMEWGKVKKEEITLPFKLSSDLPKAEPRSGTTIGEYTKRQTQEIQDDTKNRIANFKEVPRFNPKNESIDTAVVKINEAYNYYATPSRKISDEYGLYDDDGNMKTFANNCPSASFAYELRRRGWDVEAGMTGGATGKEIAEAFNIPYDEFLEEKENSIPPKTIKQLEEKLKKMGSGARGFCLMEWPDGTSHISSFEINSKGDIIYIDAQTGLSSQDKSLTGTKNPAEYYKRATKYSVIRIDNRDMNPNFLKDWVRVDDRIEPKK
jgi:hypothetical protein